MKRRMSVLDRLLGDEEKEDKDLSVLEEINYTFKSVPSNGGKILYAGGGSMVVAFLILRY